MSTTSTPPIQGSFLLPTLEHATVADAMHPGILTCRADATLTEVARLMSTYHVHCVAVGGVSNEGSGETLAWGTISDLELLAAGMAGGAEPSAAALARKPVIAVEPTMPLRDAVAVMLSEGVAHLVVFDRRAERPIGVLSSSDVTGILAWGEV